MAYSPDYHKFAQIDHDNTDNKSGRPTFKLRKSLISSYINSYDRYYSNRNSGVINAIHNYLNIIGAILIVTCGIPFLIVTIIAIYNYLFHNVWCLNLTIYPFYNDRWFGFAKTMLSGDAIMFIGFTGIIIDMIFLCPEVIDVWHRRYKKELTYEGSISFIKEQFKNYAKFSWFYMRNGVTMVIILMWLMHSFMITTIFEKEGFPEISYLENISLSKKEDYLDKYFRKYSSTHWDKYKHEEYAYAYEYSYKRIVDPRAIRSFDPCEFVLYIYRGVMYAVNGVHSFMNLFRKDPSVADKKIDDFIESKFKAKEE